MSLTWSVRLSKRRASAGASGRGEWSGDFRLRARLLPKPKIDQLLLIRSSVIIIIIAATSLPSFRPAYSQP